LIFRCHFQCLPRCIERFLSVPPRFQLFHILCYHRDFPRIRSGLQCLRQCSNCFRTADLCQRVDHRCARRGVAKQFTSSFAEIELDISCQKLPDRRHRHDSLLY
jgi:hypothetical protein